MLPVAQSSRPSFTAKTPSSARSKSHRRCQSLCRASGGAEPAPALISLPLFPLPSVLFPAQSGTLLVFEPRYLELFRTLQSNTSTAAAEASFGHILASGSAPPALMQQSVGGLPPLGVCATCKSIEELSNGRLQVNYQGARRFRLLTVDHDSQPYSVAGATWVDDEVPTDPTQQELTDTLELEVFQLLKQVVKYEQQLAAASPASSSKQSPGASDGEGSRAISSDSGGSGRGSSQQVLPPAVLMYAPPPPTKSSVAEYLIKTGHPAGDRIATWQRMGSVYGDAGAKKKPAQDPYQLLRDHLGKERRQELFSFAAASVLELGIVERLALLQCQDTAARLQFVAAAVQPHLQDLIARVSVQQAFVQP